MERKILYHLRKVDPVIYEAARKVGELEFIVPKEPREYFASLCSEILSQQLSSKAADPIERRFTELFPRKKVTAQSVLQLPDETIRNTGMSWAKVRFLKDLAQKVENREVAFAKLPQLSDEEVIEELTKIKGIGPWTAEMFLISALGRQDVFSHGDLGLRRGIEKLYNLSDPSREVVEEITLKWSPWRTYASRVLWKTMDN